MGVLRLLLTVTWAVWIWLEIVLVLLPTAIARLRGMGRTQDGGSTAFLLACVAGAFGAATWLARLRTGTLPGPAAVLLASGLVVMWLGLGVRVWAIHHLGGLFRAVVVIQRSHRLVTTGPYRWVRHPSYAGALLAAIGFGIALGHWTSLLALMLGLTIGLAYRIHVEERALRGAFGEAFEAYRVRTRRLVPRLY